MNNEFLASYQEWTRKAVGGAYTSDKNKATPQYFEPMISIIIQILDVSRLKPNG